MSMHTLVCPCCGSINEQGTRFCYQCGSLIVRNNGGQIARPFQKNIEIVLTNTRNMQKKSFILQSMLTVGRGSENNFVIQDAKVSSRHCVFLVKNGKIWIRDNNSTNGTRLNGILLHQEVEVRNGDTLDIANQRFKVHIKVPERRNYLPNTYSMDVSVQRPKKKIDIWKKVLIGLAVVIGISIVGSLLGDSQIDMVKNGYLLEHPSKTIEEALEAKFGNDIKWEYIDKQQGNDEVEASFIGAFDDEIVTYTVTFVLDDKENNTFSLDNLSINNRSAGILMTNAFIEEVFGDY